MSGGLDPKGLTSPTEMSPRGSPQSEVLTGIDPGGGVNLGVDGGDDLQPPRPSAIQNRKTQGQGPVEKESWSIIN